MGIGGGPEGVIAAAALDKLDCKFKADFYSILERIKQGAKKMGITDLDKKYDIGEIVRGDSIFVLQELLNVNL